MSDELAEFTSQLNSASPSGPTRPMPSADASNPAMSPDQVAMQKRVEERSKELLEMTLTEEELKGKVDMKYFGHSGIKLSFKDDEEKTRCIYVNICSDNPNCPAEDKKQPPNDCDLALVTHGQMQHSMHAPFLIQIGKKEGRQLVCTSEVGMYFQLFRQIPADAFSKMQPGGTKDFKYAKVTMVSSSQKSTCAGPQGVMMTGGLACGFVVTIPNQDNLKIWHLGDTALFGDMALIDDLYRPDVALVPIGSQFTMNVREAAYAVANYMPHVKTIIPLHLSSKDDTMEALDFDGFVKQCTDAGVTDKKFIHPKDFFGGAALVEK